VNFSFGQVNFSLLTINNEISAEFSIQSIFDPQMLSAMKEMYYLLSKNITSLTYNSF